MFIASDTYIRTANNPITDNVVCQEFSSAVKFGRMATNKRRALLQDELEDIDRLRSLVEHAKTTNGMTQAKLAEACRWESQGTVAQYLGGHVALNIDAAFRFSQALGVPLEAISPRLASKAIELFGATQASKETPKTVDTLVAALQPCIDNADNDVRMAIADLVKAYNNDPSEGARIARSIRALLGQL